MSPRPSPVSLLALAIVMAAAGCGGDEAAARPAAEIADSAGFRVVVNAPPSPDADPTWTVAEEPEVEVGVLEGDPDYQLFGVSGGVVLTDGTVVVANRGTHDLRFYDEGGRHLRSAGREGEGPGEFASLQLVDRFGGDSLLTWDFQQRRASVFGPDGAFVRSFRPGEAADLRFPSPAGVLSNGDLVVRQGAVFTAGEATTGASRTPVRLFLAGPEGAVKDSLGEFPGSESFVLSEERMMSVRSVTFGRGFLVSVGGERMAFGNNDAFSVRVHGEGGALLHVVRQRREPVAVGVEDFDRYHEEQLGRTEDAEFRRRTGAMFERMPRPQTFPAYRSIRLDRAGNLWVEEYRRPGDDQPVWQVFDPEGVLAARVRTPAGLRVLDLGEDYVLGVATDELDVERVRLHRLEKP